jgi:Undecaprenyl-phosphate galactose phosphotransferase WbaP
MGQSYYYPGVWNNLLAVSVCHVIVGSFLGLFPASGMNPVCELRKQLTSIGGSFLLLIALNGIIGEVSDKEILTMAIAFPMALLVAPVARFSTRTIFCQFQWWGEKVIIVGSGLQGRHVYEFLRKLPQRGLRPLGIVDDLTEEGQPSFGSVRFIGETSELVNLCRRFDCHWVIAAVADKNSAQVSNILNCASLIPNLIVLSNNMMMPSMWVESFEAAGLSGVHIQDRLLFPMQRIWKRIADIAMSSLFLLVSLPFFAFVAVWIKLTSPGPIFFCHKGRIGRDGKPFGAFKIRTMVVGAADVLEEHLKANPAARAEWEIDHKLKNDPRIIPGLGHILRRTSLDELPQLLNVLLGDMSLVGPRPIVPDEAEKYRESYPLYLRVRPGLTGLWQVSGRNNTSYEDRVRLDTYYVHNWSLWLDYFILLRTVRTVLFREGSY